MGCLLSLILHSSMPIWEVDANLMSAEGVGGEAEGLRRLAAPQATTGLHLDSGGYLRQRER